MLLCRVRRSKTVYFLEFNATDTIATLKLKLSRIIEGEREPKDLRLQVQKKDDSYTTLDDLEITDKAGIHDDSVVYMTYRTTPGGSEWEEVKVPDYEDLADDAEEEIVDVKGKGRS